MSRFGNSRTLALSAVWMTTLLMLVASSVGASNASATEGYGELGHFGSAGTSHGQFRLTGPTINGTDGTRAFGANASENAIFVGDEPKAKEYRVQKLTPSGGFVATTPGFKPPNRQGIEGIAFDPSLKRLYVLALERRSELLVNDPHEPAAGTLYAFSTDATGEVLEPASGTTEGVLVGPTTLNPQSDTLGIALLNPKGIAVDPSTHDVIISAEIDEGGEAHALVLQRINSSTGALGARYVDPLLGRERDVNSPVVSPEGVVYVERLQEIEEQYVAQIARIPSEFTSTEKPTAFISFSTSNPLESIVNPIVIFANGGSESLEYGGGLSLGLGAGGDPIFYAEAEVFEKPAGVEFGSYYTGVLAFEDVGDREGFELGWTGGQSRQTTENCAIGFGGPVPPMVSGGSGRTVFVLDAKLARVDEFGPGGSGCPTAGAEEIMTTTNGTPVSGTIPAGTEVTFTTSLTQANALSVEWSFDEGETKPQVVSADEYQNTRITHKLQKGGELTIVEKIHTDNLATPTIVKSTKISVSVDHLPPEAVIIGPSTAEVGQNMVFDGGASWDPNGTPGSSSIKSYRWDFGDGSSATSEAPEVEHIYTKAGIYEASLIVVNGYGLESDPKEINVDIEVASVKPEPVPSGSGATGVVSLPTGGTLVPQPLAPLLRDSLPEPVTHPTPSVRLAEASLKVSANGTTSAEMSCPSSEEACEGTIMLRTAGAVDGTTAGSRSKRSKKVVLMLAERAFVIAGGRRQTLSLRLSPPGRQLLARTGSLRVLAVIAAHDSNGTSNKTQERITLYLSRSHNRNLLRKRSSNK